MLTAYYSKGCDSEKMFSGYEISRCPDFKKHLNQYDVIHLDIQWCMEPAGGPEKIVSYITDKTLEELRLYYQNQLSAEINSLPEALSKICNVTGRKFVIIIDEWDVLIRDAAANEKALNDYINFLRGMFKGSEPTKYIQLAYLTGILPVKKDVTQSALNNFKQYSMLSAGPLASYVGFTEEEVKKETACGLPMDTTAQNLQIEKTEVRSSDLTIQETFCMCMMDLAMRQVQDTARIKITPTVCRMKQNFSQISSSC